MPVDLNPRIAQVDVASLGRRNQIAHKASPLSGEYQLSAEESRISTSGRLWAINHHAVLPACYYRCCSLKQSDGRV